MICRLDLFDVSGVVLRGVGDRGWGVIVNVNECGVVLMIIFLIGIGRLLCVGLLRLRIYYL